MSAAVETRRFDRPDQLLDMKARGRISIVKMADGTTGMHAVFEPGWVWEVDEKPLLGNPPSCPMRHTGYCIAGRLVVRMIETNVKTNIALATSSRSRPVTMLTSRGTSASSWCCSRRPGPDCLVRAKDAKCHHTRTSNGGAAG
jgi:hypothetical protein